MADTTPPTAAVEDNNTPVKAEPLALPKVEIRYDGLNYTERLTRAQARRDVGSVWRALANVVTAPVRVVQGLASRNKEREPRFQEIKILQDVSGVIRPGTMTLVLSPAGHGKSAYLKALAGTLPKDKLKGSISYSGITPATAAHEGVHLGQLVQYVNQLDEHLPFLTVRETFNFLFSNARVNPAEHGYEHLAASHAASVDDTIHLLQLESCQNTVVGDALLRGVSGGEKKRVTVGEGLLTAARVVMLDQISDGLDSAVTFSVVSRLKQRAAATGQSAVIALMQPTPETVALFDDIVLLREGHVVYHGPRAALPAYLTALGFHPPALQAAQVVHTTDTKGHEHHTGVDLADWLVAMLTDPARTHAKDRHRVVDAATGAVVAKDSAGEYANDDEATEPSPTATPLPTADAAAPPLTSEALAAAWKASALYAEQMAAPASVPKLQLTTSYEKAQYGHAHVHSMWHHVMLLVARQFLIMRRNRLYLRSRLITSLIMSFIIGGLYWQRPLDQAVTFYGTFLNSCMNLGFSNLSEMASVIESKYVAYRHVSNGSYPGAAYVLAGMLAHLPVAAVESLVYGAIVYHMAGMTPGADHFFFFFLVIFLVNVFFRNLMAMFSYLGKTLAAAQAMPMPIISLLIVFAGFLLARGNMGWMIFIYYIDMFAYALRSLAQNEFLSDRYSARPGGPGGPTLGELYLKAMDVQTDSAWMWGGVGFLVGSVLLIVAASFRAFAAVRFDRNIGSSRDTAHHKALDKANAAAAATGKDKPAASTSVPVQLEGSETVAVSNPMTPAPQPHTSVLPVQQMTLTFKDLKYTVNLPKHMGGGTRVLLQGITGQARPGRMLALMGQSGAGKSTLLDCLADRKNSGTMEGAIMVNGHAKDINTFARVTGYAEQMDIHMPLTTVREALDFSAQLRLPGSVTAAQRHAFVEEVIDMLELRELQHRKVGAIGSADGLAAAERKKLTIAVELCSNPSILFLDEPTTGLSATAAITVMRAVRRVANKITVIATVHQPSAELFFLFDELLLLQRGGYQVYFGPMGPQGSKLVAYLSDVPGMPPYKGGHNPSSYMLESLASKGTEKAALPSGPELQERYFDSSAWKAARGEIEAADTKYGTASPLHFASRFARSLPAQFLVLFKRNWLGYNRNVPFTFGRFMALLVISLLFGTVWYKIADDATDQPGLQSLIAAIFFSAAFYAMVSMNTSVSPTIANRAVLYRETASNGYNTLAYSLANFAAEIPWLAGTIFVVQPVVYFMFGLRPEAEVYFFHFLVSITLSGVYVSLGQTVAHLAPTFEVAQALLGILGPLFFLFGGMWSPPSQMAPGAKWFVWIDPITYAFRAIIPPHFWCEGGVAGGCPTVEIATPAGLRHFDRYWFVDFKYETLYSDRWMNLGFLAIFVLVFQTFAILCARYIRHIVR